LLLVSDQRPSLVRTIGGSERELPASGLCWLRSPRARCPGSELGWGPGLIWAAAARHLGAL